MTSSWLCDPCPSIASRFKMPHWVVNSDEVLSIFLHQKCQDAVDPTGHISHTTGAIVWTLHSAEKNAEINRKRLNRSKLNVSNGFKYNVTWQ